MTWAEKMDCRGMCPRCGGDSGSTVCRTYTKAKRFVQKQRQTWWQWFRGVLYGHWEYKKNA